MVQITELSFRYGEPGRGEQGFALRIDELRVAAGESVAFVGPSGSGKTTLLHLVAGILAPDAGHVLVAGEDLATLDDARRRAFRVAKIGLVFQEFELLDYLSVLDNILLPYRIHSILRLDGAARDRAGALAERLGIGDKLARRPGSLSQGERQRAAVCRSLVTGVLDALFELTNESGATLLAVTHNLELLPRFDRVIDFKDFQPPPAARS